ncbi:MAG TPA: cytochrome P450 [Vicinamibacterales bacterium]|nr:cytochrome P450 [Vicinamibacterales bacterium]
MPARPPGPGVHLLLAVLSQVLPRSLPFDPLAFGVDIARRYGDLAYYHLGPLHVYQVNHPDLARQILVEQAERFHKPRLLKHAFRPFAGEGLLTSDGPAWKQQRKLIQPAFHHAHLAAYAAVMVAYARQWIDRLEDGLVLEIQSEMAGLTLGIVVKTLFGADVTREAADVGKLMVAVLDAANQRLNSVFQVPSWVPSRRNLREKRALARLDAILRALIVERRSSAGQRDDLLSVLLRATDAESSVRMSDRQLRDEMMTLFLAGHETTATALTWTWYLLSQHPDVDAKLTGELDRVLGQRTPTVADLANLPYTDMIVREALRLYPPAPGVAREPIDAVTIAGYVVPRGSLISIDTYAIHRDARFFPDPERFDPERFAAGWEDRIPRYAYLPFGGGPRVCIGNGFALMEARLILATVAQRFRLTAEPNQDVRPIQLVTVRPRDGIRMSATTRARHVAV